jgi:hypothetical protein
MNNQIGNIFYPKKKLLKKTDNQLEYIFELEDSNLKLNIQGINDFKFLYTDEKQLILRKNINTFLISLDGGKTYQFEKRIVGLKIYQIYPLSNGYYLLCGVTNDFKAYIYLLDETLNELNKIEQGKMGWHSQDAINEYNGIVMYVEYQNFEKDAPLPKTISVFKSKDFGITWKRVFQKSHPDEVRHGHTLQRDPYTNNWLVTFGDNPSQSKWFISKDQGNNWSEITDKTYILEEFPSLSMCAHRTTSIKIDKDNYYFSTDDLMGSALDYFIEYKGRRKSSAKIYKSLKTEPIKLEYIANIGIHGRCMVDIGKGYIILTEAKYATHNMQVYYISQDNLSKVYFLCDIYGYKRHSGPASMCSEVINDSYFYTTIARTMLLGSDAQTIKWNFQYLLKNNLNLEYNVVDYIKLEEHLWFLNKKDALKDIVFKGNSVLFSLNKKQESFYMLLDNSKVDIINAKELFKVNHKNKLFSISLNTEMKDDISLKIYIQFFNNSKKISSESYILKNGFNDIKFYNINNGDYIRILFRIENKSKMETQLNISKLLFDVDLTTQSNIISNKIADDIKLFFFQNNNSDFKNFKPRNDSIAYPIKYPLDWSVNPFNDRNWCFQLHAWRMMDPLLLKYTKFKNIELLKQCLIIIQDWKKFTFDAKNETKFTWYDMATGLRALKLAYFANEIFNTNIEFKISNVYKDTIIFLMKRHIDILSKQNIANNNHGVFQVHGLGMLSYIIDDKDNMQYTLEKMNILIRNQFYDDGFHSENSDKYHIFVLNMFINIINFTLYQKDKVLVNVIKNAQEVLKFTIFPNKEPLLIGDTDYKIRKIDFNISKSTNNIFIKLFKDSGYLFIRSAFLTNELSSSMLFFQTVFKNNTHRHGDDFNILFYEFGKNILVDAGQYSYDYDTKEREYVISTKAHNCILIDNMDYSMDSAFYYDSTVKEYDEKDGVFIVKTSLQRKDFEVLHDRLILYKPKEFLVVIDKMKSAIERTYNQIWHFHQDLEISKENNLFKTEINENNKMKIIPMVYKNDRFVINDNVKLIKGQTEPYMQGWRSLKYREMIPNYALENEIQAKNSLLVTKFLFNDNDISIDVLKNDLILKSDKLNLDLNIDVS